jgi:CBS domain-containing protein
MPRNTPVSQVMTTDVLWFRAEEPVAEAMARLVERGVDGAPVVGADNAVIGIVSTDDFIVQETVVHVPTVISLFGASIELPGSKRHFEEDLRKALGSTVRDIMSEQVITVGPDATIEQAAELLHERHVSRLPVVDETGLVGIVSRVDILREILRTEAEPTGDA